LADQRSGKWSSAVPNSVDNDTNINYIRLAEEPVCKPYRSNQVKLEGGSHCTRSNVEPKSIRHFTVFYVSFPQAPVIQWLV